MVGIAMILGAYLTDTRLAAGYFSGVALLVVWIALLALADWRGSRPHFETLRSDQAAEHAALRAELAKHLPAKQDD